MPLDFLIIDNEHALVELCEQLKGSIWLAVDTEFERERTFYPELCLLQIANSDIAAVIDPFAIDNIEPLFDLLYDTSITKVFHAARQDLEIFFNITGKVPVPLFDTQIAAPLLGHNDQIGYANLVKNILAVELDKKHTRTDWKKRPLTDSQLRYAVDDVIYLGQLYEQLLAKLTTLNRLEWLTDDFTALADAELYKPDPEKVWMKIKNANRLKGKELSVLQSLAAWRERTARQQNRPKKWLISDDTLIAMARLLPDNPADLSGIKGLHERLYKRHASELLEIIAKAQHRTPPTLAMSKAGKALNVQEQAKVDVLMAIVRLRAQENDLNPTILASRKELESFVQGQTGSALLTGWRENLIGHELCEFLAGKINLQVENQRLSMVANSQKDGITQSFQKK